MNEKRKPATLTGIAAVKYVALAKIHAEHQLTFSQTESARANKKSMQIYFLRTLLFIQLSSIAKELASLTLQAITAWVLSLAQAVNSNHNNSCLNVQRNTLYS